MPNPHAARKRRDAVRREQMRFEEEKKLAAKAAELRAMTSGLNPKASSVGTGRIAGSLLHDQRVFRRDTGPKPLSLGGNGMCTLKSAPKYEGELAQREAAAQKAITEKRSRTAPAYNKGGDVYYTEEMLQDFTAGAHRRRG